MSNSLNFLNRPPTPAKTYGPQPKPGASTGSATAAAPKAAFLDKANPWAVGSAGSPTAGSKGAPAQPAYNPLPQNTTPAKAKTPARSTPTPQRAAVPSRGYNYTDASYTGATPQQRAREIDQAEMNAQATRQRRERERARAQPAAPAPLQVAARPPAPMAIIEPAALTQTAANAAQLAQAAVGPALQAAQGFVSPLMRRLNSWMLGSGQGGDPYLAQQQGGYPTTPATPQAEYVDPFLAQQRSGYPPQPTPAATEEITNPYLRQQRGLPPLQPAYNPLAGLFAPQQAAPVPGAQPGIAPTAEQVQTARLAQQQADAARFNVAPDQIQAAQQRAANAPTPEAARAAANAAQAGTNAPQTPIKQPAPPKGQQPEPLFYGYTAPGPLVVDRRDRIRANLQGGELMPRVSNPWAYTAIGMQALTPDRVLASERADRPWSSLTDAEKYYRRFGVMPTGPQMIPNTDKVDAIVEQRDAQHERLIAEYIAKYGKYPPWGYEGAPRTSEAGPIQHGPSGQVARQAAPAAGQAPAGPAATAGTASQQILQPPPGGINNTLELQKINPQGFETDTPTITRGNALTLAQQIGQRYMPGIDFRNMTPDQIAALLLNYSAPAAQDAQYRYDLWYLTQLLASE